MIFRSQNPQQPLPPGFVGDGTVTIHWHTDGNEGLGPDPIIGSLSIGATRDFAFLGPARTCCLKKATAMHRNSENGTKGTEGKGESW